jgi:hypothetical protein
LVAIEGYSDGALDGGEGWVFGKTLIERLDQFGTGTAYHGEPESHMKSEEVHASGSIPKC